MVISLGPSCLQYTLLPSLLLGEYLTIVVNCIFRTKNDFTLTGRSYSAYGAEFELPDMEYADDTAVLFESRGDVDIGVPKLIEHFALFGMEIHVGNALNEKSSKSEILFVAAPEIMYRDPETFDGQDLSNIEFGNGLYMPVVASFKYLGSVLTRNCRDVSLAHEYFRASVAHRTCILYVACDTKNRRSHVVNLSRVRL